MKNALPWAAFALLFALPAARAAENPAPPVMTAPQTPPPAIVLALQKATDGLQMMSETDAPFEVVFWALEAEKKTETKAENDAAEEKTAAAELVGTNKISVEKLAELVGAPQDAKIEIRDLDEFFASVATVEEWMNDEERATAKRFAGLLETLKTEIENAQVLVWGDAKKRVAIIGKCEAGLAGVTTLVVET